MKLFLSMVKLTKIQFFHFLEGGAKVKVNTKICEIYTEKGITFDVYGLVDGTLIEINDKLEEHPEYLLESVRSYMKRKIKILIK